jgi:hypothetical protein
MRAVSSMQHMLQEARLTERTHELAKESKGDGAAGWKESTYERGEEVVKPLMNSDALSPSLSLSPWLSTHTQVTQKCT